MQSQGLGLAEFSPAVLARFGAACRVAGYRDFVSIRGDKPMLAFLLATGLCPVEPVVLGPVDGDCWVGSPAGCRPGRHLAPASVVTYVWHARAFGQRLAGGDRIELERLDAAFVRRFVLDTCPRRGRATAKVTVVALRQLLVFLYLEEAIDRPLVNAVPSVAGARLSGLPKRLGRGEVQRMLDVCDRGTVVGRRNFAIVMLLARLKSRAGRTAGLLLDDIDWRSGEITVRGKGRGHRLPLPDAVGDADRSYICETGGR